MGRCLGREEGQRSQFTPTRLIGVHGQTRPQIRRPARQVRAVKVVSRPIRGKPCRFEVSIRFRPEEIDKTDLPGRKSIETYLRVWYTVRSAEPLPANRTICCPPQRQLGHFFCFHLLPSLNYELVMQPDDPFKREG